MHPSVATFVTQNALTHVSSHARTRVELTSLGSRATESSHARPRKQRERSRAQLPAVLGLNTASLVACLACLASLAQTEVREDKRKSCSDDSQPTRQHAHRYSASKARIGSRSSGKETRVLCVWVCGEGRREGETREQKGKKRERSVFPCTDGHVYQGYCSCGEDPTINQSVSGAHHATRVAPLLLSLPFASLRRMTHAIPPLIFPHKLTQAFVGIKTLFLSLTLCLLFIHRHTQAVTSHSRDASLRPSFPLSLS